MVMQKILHLIENNIRKYLGVNRHLGGESHAVCNLLSNGLEKNNCVCECKYPLKEKRMKQMLENVNI